MTPKYRLQSNYTLTELSIATVQGDDNCNVRIPGPEYNVDLSVLARPVFVA